MASRTHVCVSGPLADYAAGFRSHLVEQGYGPYTVDDHLRLMARASDWLGRCGLDGVDLTAVRAEQFLGARRAEGHTRLVSMRGMDPLLSYLRCVGVTAVPELAATPVEVLVGATGATWSKNEACQLRLFATIWAWLAGSLHTDQSRKKAI